MINPTASGLGRVFVCVDSHVLDHAHETGTDAERGTEIARFVRNVLGGMSRAAAAALVPDEKWRETCLKLDFSRLVGDLHDVRGEMAYALDTASGAVRELGSNIGRKYPPLSATEVGGTNDIEGVRIDEVPVVIDVKTGQSVTPAADNPQLKFHARVRQILTGAPAVEGRIAYVSEDGRVTLDCATFDAFALDSFGDDLAALVARVAEARARIAGGGRVIVVSGEHCAYCPAMTSCPKFVALARTMVSDIDDIATRLEKMTPEQQGIAWLKAKDVEGLLEHVLGNLKALAAARPIPLPDGQFVAKVPWGTPKRLDHEKALVMLRKKGATDAEVASLYTSDKGYQTRAVSASKAAAAMRDRPAVAPAQPESTPAPAESKPARGTRKKKDAA